MAQAVFGLLWVVVGAIITGGMQLVLESRREKRDIQRAKRLIGAELRETSYACLALLELGSWPEPEGLDREGILFPSAAWDENRVHLASAAIDDELWNRLSTIYSALKGYRKRILDSSRENIGGALTEDDKKDFQELADAVNDLQTKLGLRPSRLVQ